MMNRRNFLGTITGATAAAMLGKNLSWGAEWHKLDRIGIEAYTIRDLLKADFSGTMEKIAAIGYKEIEYGPTIDDPKAARALLDRLGMTSPSGAFDYKDMVEKWSYVSDHCHIMGQTYLVIGSIDSALRKQPDGWKRAAESYNHTGEIARKDGITLTYHCHWMEFVPRPDGTIPYDILIQNTDPNFVQMEMDLGWTNVGGSDPLKWFAKYPGRFPLVHIKDFKKLPDPKHVYDGNFDGDEVIPDMTAVGQGVIDWKRIFRHFGQAGVKHYYVEHDRPADPMEVARDSYEYLAKLRF
jgi:sugar phosphate isomerase/epimerase